MAILQLLDTADPELEDGVDDILGTFQVHSLQFYEDFIPIKT